MTSSCCGFGDQVIVNVQKPTSEKESKDEVETVVGDHSSEGAQCADESGNPQPVVAAQSG